MKDKLINATFYSAAFALAIALGSCSDQAEEKNSSEQVVYSQNLNKATIPVEGMTCNACVASIKKKLTTVEGLEEVEVSLQHRHVAFAYDPAKVKPEQVQQAINEIGFKAGEPVTEGERE